MSCDLPILKRCCFCFPLRPGLLVWGYLKMTIDIVLIALASIILSDKRMHCGHITAKDTACFIWILVMLIVILDVIYDFIFLLATHTRNATLMRSSFYYNIFLFIISNVAFFLVLGYVVDNFNTPGYRPFELLMTSIITGLVNAVLQFYLILLLRSEVRRLNNDCCVTFENHGADSKCYMTLHLSTTDITKDLQVDK